MNMPPDMRAVSLVMNFRCLPEGAPVRTPDGETGLGDALGTMMSPCVLCGTKGLPLPVFAKPGLREPQEEFVEINEAGQTIFRASIHHFLS
jgi:hypothetical protein